MVFRVNSGEDFEWKIVRVQGGATHWITVEHDDGVSWWGVSLPEGDYRLEARFVDDEEQDEDETDYITVIRW